MARQPTVDRRLLAGYLGLTYGIAWGGVTLLWLLGADLGGGTGQGLGTVVFMGAPGIAAIAVLRSSRRSVRRGCGLYLGRIRWTVLAWLTPVGLTAAMIGVGLTLPETTFASDYSVFLLELGFTEEAATETVADLEGAAVPVIVILGGLGLLLGGTLFAVVALGEELGWRGLLLTGLAPLGFWKLSVVTGLVWGIWHTPLLFLGLQFSDHPLLGIVLLTTATVAYSPIYTYLTVRARSVLAATFLHGSFILGTFTAVFLSDGSELLISSFGVLGIVAGLLGTVTCVVHDRILATEQITTGDPMRPWSR